MSSVVCRDLVKIYKTGEVEVIALRGLNMEVRPGELRVIVGRSGSGKTTLLNLIGGIDRPSAGQVIVDDINVANLPEKKLVEYRRKHVGFVFQFYNLMPNLTAEENVEMATEISQDPLPAAEALELANSNPDSDQAPEALMLAATAQRRAKNREKALSTLERLAEKYPTTPQGKKAQELLKEFRRR